MRLVRILLIAVAAVVVAGAVASASPPIRAAFETEPSPEVSATPDPSGTPDPTESPEPEPAETSTPEALANETSPLDTDATAAEEDAAAAPDFSTCVGLHGLENAICRHEALLEVQPASLGLQNALAHLESNLARHEEGRAAAQGNGCPGKSCEAPGHGTASGTPER